jgi:hypothetical protein
VQSAQKPFHHITGFEVESFQGRKRLRIETVGQGEGIRHGKKSAPSPLRAQAPSFAFSKESA